MRTTRLFLAVLGVSLASAQSTVTSSSYAPPATTATGLPTATYQAVFPDSADHPTGNFTLTSFPYSLGVSIHVTLHNLPPQSDAGPFTYHIHTHPIPATSGNCSAALAHLDPTSRGETPPCDASAPETCQVGDLSGKHGKITSEGSFEARYDDAFLSTDAKSAAFVGGRSVVVHARDKTRLVCANLVLVKGVDGTVGGGGSTTAVTHTRMPPSGTMSSETAGATSTGAAAKGGVVGAGGAVVLAAVGMLVL